MSSRAGVLHVVAQREAVSDRSAAKSVAEITPLPGGEESARYAHEQMLSLVRRVFFPGWPRPARQVVVSAVDQHQQVGRICLQIGQALAEQGPGRVCVAEAVPRGPECEMSFGRSTNDPVCDQESSSGSLRESSHQVSEKLWLMPAQSFLEGHDEGLSAGWLRGRLALLRQEYDYLILHAPPAAECSAAALLGCLCDGVILVVEANSTRRITAGRAQERLQAANARLLGTILSERRFEIPEAVYRRL